MASKQENKITVIEDNLYLNDFQIDDDQVVSYFQNLSESENLEKKLVNLLKIGITVTKSISTTENVNYVEKAFDNLDSNFKQKLDLVFSDNGQFSGILKEHFGEDGKIIKELFDPNREGSPLYSLKLELDKNLLGIREKLGIDAAVKEVAEKSTQKGVNFEEQCEKKLEWIANIHSDKLERTGNEHGKLSRSKKGDFVITLGDTSKKIVFEMKNKGSITMAEVQKELKESMENREAEYGIFVARSKDSLPKSVGWFNEYDGNQLVCAIENGDGDSIIDGEIIHIAYKWARAKLRLESSKGKKLDPTFIIEKTSEIKKKIGDMRKIKTQCTNIEKSSEAIRDTAKNTEADIKKELDAIIESLDSN